MRYKKYFKYSRKIYYLKFKKGILVNEETVDNYYGIMSIDDDGNYIEDETVEVFLLKIPLKYKCIEDIYITANDRLSTGFKIDKHDDYYEFKFYNHEYAVHKIFYELKKRNLLKVKKIIYKPKWENTTDFYEDMEVFPIYIDAKGIWQCTYDIVVAIIELGLKCLYKSVKSIKNKDKRKWEIENV